MRYDPKIWHNKNFQEDNKISADEIYEIKIIKFPLSKIHNTWSQNLTAKNG